MVLRCTFVHLVCHAEILVWIMTFQRNQILLLMNLLSSSAFQCATNFSIESFTNESQFIRHSNSGCEWRKKKWNVTMIIWCMQKMHRKEKKIHPEPNHRLIINYNVAHIFFPSLFACHRSKSFACWISFFLHSHGMIQCVQIKSFETGNAILLLFGVKTLLNASTKLELSLGDKRHRRRKKREYCNNNCILSRWCRAIRNEGKKSSFAWM